MLFAVLSSHPEYGKYVGWIAAVLLLLYGASGLRSVAAALLLKLYEMFIQKSALP